MKYALLAGVLACIACRHEALLVPPSLPKIETYGCSARQVRDDAKVSWWHVYVWAEYPSGTEKWQRIFAIRDGAEPVAKPLADCKYWMQGVRRAARSGK